MERKRRDRWTNGRTRDRGRGRDKEKVGEGIDTE